MWLEFVVIIALWITLITIAIRKFLIKRKKINLVVISIVTAGITIYVQSILINKNLSNLIAFLK